MNGTVSDAHSGEPLPSANIRIMGTNRGTVTNPGGEFTLPIDSGAQRIIVSYISYQPETLTVDLKLSSVLTVKLQPSPIIVPEVLILGEDPALEIIRKAIAHKHSWMEKLKTYSFDAFTRQVLWSDTSIAGITESYSTGYMRTGDTLREIIRQRRQTRNIPESDNLAAVQRIVNFNEDEIRLFSFHVNGRQSAYKFVGPTAPDALDNYDYTLLGTSVTNGIETYRIRMTPKSRIKPLFDGTIVIANETFAIIGVDVKTNETLSIPFVKDVDLHYQQEFALYDSCFWMPADIHIDGGFSIGVVGLSLPRIGINLISSIYDYRINPDLPDSVFKRPHLDIDSSSMKMDSLFWKTHDVLPLTHEQAHAYASLDTGDTIDKQFKPKGALASFGDNNNTGSLLDYLDTRYDRVEGFYVGGKIDLNKLTGYAKLEAGLGRALAGKWTEYYSRVTAFPFNHNHLDFGGE
ncbi:MAG TPA: DUF5686 family protein, partial [Bacteroidota bacterium]|nr:DUF5686 family protein [Bacteroidota bacterium]